MTDNKLEIVVVVGGKKVPMEVNLNEPLKSLFEKAMNGAGVAGEQKLADWEFKTEAGALLDPNKKLAEIGAAAGFMIFLSQKVGATG